MYFLLHGTPGLFCPLYTFEQLPTLPTYCPMCKHHRKGELAHLTLHWHSRKCGTLKPTDYIQIGRVSWASWWKWTGQVTEILISYIYLSFTHKPHLYGTLIFFVPFLFAVNSKLTDICGRMGRNRGYQVTLSTVKLRFIFMIYATF